MLAPLSPYLKRSFYLFGLGVVNLFMAGCPELQTINTAPAAAVIARVQESPSGGGLEYKRDDFFEEDTSIALGSAWLTSKDLKKAKLFVFGLDEVKPSGGKPRDLLSFVAKKDSTVDVGITNIFGVTLTDNNAVTILVTRRQMVTTFSPEQLNRWAERAAPFIQGDEAYVAFTSKITENIITTDEYTTTTWTGNAAVNAIKILDTTYGSSGQVKTADPVIWVGLVGCKWSRNGPGGKPSITELSPNEFKEVLRSFGVK